MRVSIIGGIWKSRVLVAPKGPAIRPTSQKVRKSLFDILGPRLQGARVLDLFAGTGALGLEALSRGAEKLVAVDRSRFCTEAIQNSCIHLKLTTIPIEVLVQDAFATIKKMGQSKRTFDLIFVDPPYDADVGTKALRGISAHAILAPSGLVIFEHPTYVHPPAEIEEQGRGLVLRRSERYGNTGLAFYE